MPQDSTLYGVARIRSHEKELIGRDRMRRLADALPEDALRLLTDAGYGNMPDAVLADVDKMIDNQLAETYALIREITPDAKLTDLYLMKADIHNIKLLLKLRLTESREEPAYAAGGVFPPERLADMVEKKEYAALPEELRSAVEELEIGFLTSGADPVLLSSRLDSAYMSYAIKHGDAFTKEYFRAAVDFDNVLALLRLRSSGADTARIRAVLMAGGDIPADKLAEAAETPVEALGRAVCKGPARDALIRGLDEIARTGRISALEKARDDYLISLAKKGKNDSESIAPIIGFLLAREQEARCIRLIMTAKRNGLPESVITERMRELYG